MLNIVTSFERGALSSEEPSHRTEQLRMDANKLSNELDRGFRKRKNDGQLKEQTKLDKLKLD